MSACGVWQLIFLLRDVDGRSLMIQVKATVGELTRGLWNRFLRESWRWDGRMYFPRAFHVTSRSVDEKGSVH